MRKFKKGDTVYLQAKGRHENELKNWSKVDGLQVGEALIVVDVQGWPEGDAPWIRVTPSRSGGNIVHNPKKFAYEKA